VSLVHGTVERNRRQGGEDVQSGSGLRPSISNDNGTSIISIQLDRQVHLYAQLTTSFSEICGGGGQSRDLNGEDDEECDGLGEELHVCVRKTQRGRVQEIRRCVENGVLHHLY